jgi:hypothetical protein
MSRAFSDFVGAADFDLLFFAGIRCLLLRDN